MFKNKICDGLSCRVKGTQMKEKFNQILKDAKSIRKPEIDAIIAIFCDNDIDIADIDFEELDSLIDTAVQFKGWVLKPTKDKIFNAINEYYMDKSYDEIEDNIVDEVRLSPWKTAKRLGYLISADKYREDNLYYIKSTDRIGAGNTCKDIIIKKSWSAVTAYLTSEASKKGLKGHYKTNNGIEERVVNFNPKGSRADEVRQLMIAFNPSENDFFTFRGQSSFNTWTEPKYATFSKEESLTFEESKKILEPFFSLLANLTESEADPKEAQKYIINILATQYQTKKVPQVCMVFIGSQGTGKGLFYEILSGIYTKKHVGLGKKGKSIFDMSDNQALKDALVYVADDMNMKKFYDEVKGYVANSEFTLKELYSNGVTYPNYALFINNMNTEKGVLPFALDADDRRFNVFESYIPLNRTPWFNADIYDYLTKDEMFLATLGRYLAGFEIDEDKASKPFENGIRKKMIEEGQNKSMQFLKALKKCDLQWFEKHGAGSIKTKDSYTILSTLNRAFRGKWTLYVTEVQLFFSQMFDGKVLNRSFAEEVGIDRGRDGSHGEWYYKIDVIRPKESIPVPPQLPPKI